MRFFFIVSREYIRRVSPFLPEEATTRCTTSPARAIVGNDRRAKRKKGVPSYYAPPFFGLPPSSRTGSSGHQGGPDPRRGSVVHVQPVRGLPHQPRQGPGPLDLGLLLEPAALRRRGERDLPRFMYYCCFGGHRCSLGTVCVYVEVWPFGERVEKLTAFVEATSEEMLQSSFLLLPERCCRRLRTSWMLLLPGRTLVGNK